MYFAELAALRSFEICGVYVRVSGGERGWSWVYLLQISANAHLLIALFPLSGFHYISRGIDNLDRVTLI